MSNRTVRRVAGLLLAASLLLLPGRAAEEEPNKSGPAEFKRIKFRNIGPAAGGRVSRACGVPGDPKTYYAATASGGVWKSTDGGHTWKSIFDDQPIASIGSIAVSPSDPSVVYVGSGEANIRGNVQPGNGIYKSVDGGKTWKHVWKQEGQIGTMIVHPTNPDVAFAAVLGHAFGPNKERGVYRTTDGGKTWQRVLYKEPADQDTGASDVAFDPSNPKVVFAGLWQVRRKPWEMTSGGPGSGLYVSRDGGDTWTQLVAPPAADSPEAAKEPPANVKRCEGLPEGIWGKIGLAVAPSDGRRVYALIEAEKGGLFRSDDGGDTWKLINDARGLRQRAWYFSTLTVHPKNPDVVYFPQVPLLKSIDGGKTLQRVKGPHHGDHHDLWIDPKDPDRMIDSNDGGVDVTVNGGETWYAPPLPICQFYHIACDDRVPYHVSGTMQDLGTASGPSNSLARGGIRLGDWHSVGGGETGFTAPDPSDPNVVYAGEYGGYLSRYDHRLRQAKSIGKYPYNPSGHGAEDLKYRFQWTAPLVVSRHDPRTVYHAGNVVFKTTDAGKTWEAVSGDLTRDNKGYQKWSGGPITGDNTGVEVYGTVFSLAESPKQKGLLWAGSDDGLVHVTRDGGKTWENVTPGINLAPKWGTVCCIEPSPHEPGTAFVVVDAHRLDDMKPYLFRTDDYGKSWTKLGDKIPDEGYLRVVREDPKKKDLLYVGAERGLLYSRDGGKTWDRLKLNLPTVAVSDLVVKGDDLVVGTSGRSIWILDDLTPIRDWSPDLAKKDVHLFPVRETHRYRYHGSFEDKPPAGSGQNPPAGAVIHYFLKTKPKGDITLEIHGPGGKVATLSSKEEKAEKGSEQGDYSEDDEKTPLPTSPGLHRVVWDLKHEGAKLIKGAKVDSGKVDEGPLVAPGRYEVRLIVDGQTYKTPLDVLLDGRWKAIPRPPAKLGSGRPDEGDSAISNDLDAQEKLVLKLRDDITRLAAVANDLRSVKSQITARDALLKDDDRAAELIKAGKEFVKKLDELEGKLHNPKAKVAYDILAQKGGAKLYSQLAWLYELAKDSDGEPGQGWKEVYDEQRAMLDRYASEWDKLVKEDLVRLNGLAKKHDLPVVVIPARKDREPK